MSVAPCEHKFVFLRRERKKIEGMYNSNWHAWDLFFCERCLTIARANEQNVNSRAEPEWW